MSNCPERTCIVCREKNSKENLLRIASKGEIYLFDEKQIIQSRGQYICKKNDCINRLSKHKKIKVPMEELLKMLSVVKNQSKDYLNILKAMKNSQELAFGMNMIFEEIEKVHFMIIAEDISDKNNRRLIERAKEKNIPYVHYGTKEKLGDIFGKGEVNVIAVKNKRVARGLI